MRLVALLLMLMPGMVPAAPVPGDFKKKTDWDLLQGTWVVIDFNVHGNASNARPERLMKFDKETIQILDAGSVDLECQVKLDVKHSLKLMSWIPRPPRQDSYSCAYSVTGDSLTIALSHQVAKSPTSLEPGRGMTVYQLKRKPPQ